MAFDPAAAHAAMAQMAAQIAALHAQVQHQAHVPSIPVAQAPARAERPRLPPPSQYDGRSAAALDGWLRELQQQFDWYSAIDDATRLRFAGALLKGTALDWWSSLAEPGAPPAGVAPPSSPDSSKPTTFVEFVARLRGRFQPIDSAQTARVQLDDLRQGPKQSVQDYISSFRALLVRVPDMSEGDRVHRFIRGLRAQIATQLRVNGVSTLDASIAMAARVGSIAEYGVAVGSGASPASAAASSHGDAMDLSNVEGLERESTTDAYGDRASAPVTQGQLAELLNAMRNDRSSGRSKDSKAGGKDIVAAIAKRFKLTAEQVREHFDKGQCFNCDGTGHSSRACTKPPKKN